MSDPVSAPAKLTHLRALLRECEAVLVAFSGGLDSAFVLKIAAEELGDRATAITALSASYAANEKARATELALAWGIRQEFVHTKELSDPRYAENPPTRCYHCKSELFSAMSLWRDAHASAALLIDGTTVDDLGDFRPGLQAASDAGVRHLLVEAGLTKADLRELARTMDLPIADLPGTACLASRFPYGTPITVERLQRIEAAEAIVRGHGFHQVRVRDHEPIARLEIGPAEMGRFSDPALGAALQRELTALGFTYVALDLGGYRTGALNEILAREPVARG